MNKDTVLISIHGISKESFTTVLRNLADNLDKTGVDDNAMMETSELYTNLEYDFIESCETMNEICKKIKEDKP